MAPLLVGRVNRLCGWTAGDVYRFLVWSLYFFYQHPWLLFGLLLKDCSAMILKQTRTYKGSSGAINCRNPCSLIEKDSSDTFSASKEPSEAYPKSFACASVDRETKKPGNSESSKTSENSKFESIFDVDQLPIESNKNDRLESLEECPSLGIQTIESWLQMANYDGGNLSIADDGAKKTSDLYPDAGFSFLCWPWQSGIVRRRKSDETNMYLHASFFGKVGKIPTEHDDDLACEMNSFCSSHQHPLGCPKQEPPEDVETKGKTSVSNQNNTQSVSGGGGGSLVTGVHKSSNKGNPRGVSNSGSGGDDGDDDRRPNVPVGGCQGDNQCYIEGNEEGNVDMDDGNDDDDDKYDDDDGSDNNGIKDEKEVCSCQEATGACNNQMDVKLMTGDVGRSFESTRCEASEGSLSFTSHESGQPIQKSKECCKNVSKVSHVVGSKKRSDQELKLDVITARRISQPTSTYQIMSSLPGEDTGKDAEAEVHLQKAFACRHRNMGTWEECSDLSCQTIQQLLAHSQNCHMRVLGGCGRCIRFKDTLLSHALSCKLPRGACVIEKCDDIRRYKDRTDIPGNRYWSHKLDQLFFRPSPPRSPTVVQNEPDFFPREDETDDQVESSQGDSLTLSSLKSANENSAREMQGAWSQYHLDRPPDFPQPFENIPTLSEAHVTVARCPGIDVEEDESATSAVPLSAICVPGTSRATENVMPRQEIIWPLNKEYFSVGEDECYVENVHWARERHIGGGSCGRCYLCIDLNTSFLFAIKEIPESSFELNEVQVWGHLSGRHPGILELYGAVKYDAKVTIFMEYMEGGSVDHVGKMHETLACHIFCKVLSAVDFMHSQGIVHRDIKGANILTDERGEKVKLADFGTSIWLSNGYQQDDFPQGTEPFMAPEVCRSECHSFSADIWSSMCVLYQMLKGVHPWEQYRHSDRLVLLYKIGSAKTPPPSPPCSPELEDVFNKGFKLEPKQRPTAKELLKHQVFVAAQDVSNVATPCFSNGYDPDYESSLSSLISSLADSSPASGREDDDDDDDDGYDDDGSHDIEQDGPQVNGAANIEPSQELQSAEEQLHSLQNELFRSLPSEELERLVLNGIAENSSMTDNDINLLSNQEDFDLESLIEQINLDSSVTSEWSYSMSDLTKLHIKNIDGDLMFTIRERPTTTYGSLGRDHHGNIASVLSIEAFALTSDDGFPLDVHAEIGEEEQSVRAVRAHDTDRWEPYRWRVDVHGLVEQWTNF